jgi:hypothetical protein
VTTDTGAPFISRIDFETWTSYSPKGGDAARATRGMQLYFWWVAHALFAKEPIPISGLIGVQSPSLTGMAMVERPGVYRVELLGPAAITGRPRTGAPIATVYSFFDRTGPCDILAQEWAKIQHDYGAPGRIELPSRAFICVIKHRYVDMDARTADAVSELSDFVGYAAFAHSTGDSPPDETRRAYVAAMGPNDHRALRHLQRIEAGRRLHAPVERTA